MCSTEEGMQWGGGCSVWRRTPSLQKRHTFNADKGVQYTAGYVVGWCSVRRRTPSLRKRHTFNADKGVQYRGEYVVGWSVFSTKKAHPLVQTRMCSTEEGM